MNPSIGLIAAKARARSSPMLVASLAIHCLVLFILFLFIGEKPYGDGIFRSTKSGTFSATWIPANGDGQGRAIDTIVPDSQSAGPMDVLDTWEVQPAPKNSPVLELPKTDPQTVFNSESNDSITSTGESDSVVQSRREPVTEDFGSTKSTPHKIDATSVSPRRSATDVRASSQSELPGSDVPGDDRPDSKRAGAGKNSGRKASSGGGSSKAEGSRIEFFGILTRAKRVVYAIDASESMRQHNAMEAARQELWSSLQDLALTSQFQIVFFNLTNHTMNRPGERPRLLAATSSNLRMAKQFLTGIQPDSGTDRFAALTHAFSLEPDVIYLLTDADAPELSAKDLWDIRRANKRSTVIHVVEFGIGGDLSRDTFLKQLARQNGGAHCYHDLTKVER